MKKILLFLGILCLIVFLFFYYKSCKNGNNITSKTQEEFIDYILNNMKEYNAEIEVTVISNKTENLYKIKQEENPEKSVQEIISPENISGMIIQLQGTNLKISNSSLNLEKIYDNYEPIINNSLFLSGFINDYKNNKSRNYEVEEELILEVELDNTTNTYAKYKELHINKNTKKIEKLIIKDNAKKVRVSIKYNDIEIK